MWDDDARMKVLRTPDSRFDRIPDFPFEPQYVQVTDELRMHYIDEGPREGPVVLLLHGEPTWSFLYRKMVPPLAAAGFRTLAPDLIGFGKSDKPTKMSDYSYAKHEEWLLAFLDALGLEDITMFAQDWGSLLGLRIAGTVEIAGRDLRVTINRVEVRFPRNIANCAADAVLAE